MNFKKYDVITLDYSDKVVVLETLEYNGETFLYVDKVNDEETETLKEFHILRLCEDGYLEKEENQEILMEILPLFNKMLKTSE